MKNFLRFSLLTLLMAVFSSAWAEETPYKTLLFGSDYNSEPVNSYAITWSASYEGFRCTIQNFNNNQNGWNYIRGGSKSNAWEGSITTAAAIDKLVTKVVVTVDKVSNNDGARLEVADNDEFSEAISVPMNLAQSNTTTYVTYTIPVEVQAANLYYRFVFNQKKGSSNGELQISKIQFFVDNGEPTLIPVASSCTITPTILEVGAEGSFDATLEANFTGLDLTDWTSDNPEVLSVNSSYYVAHKAGTANVTFTPKPLENVEGWEQYEAVSFTQTITVVAPRQDPAFSFTPSSMTIVKGDNSWDQPEFSCANSSYFITGGKAQVTSDNQYVAYWTPNTGLVVTGELGTANILVSFVGDETWKPSEATLTVNVVADPRQDPAFSFTPSSINITKGDDSWTQPVFSCADESFFINQGKMAYTSNHDVVAYWTPNDGLVLGSETGTATILVSYVGDDNWQPCEATLEVTVTGATTYVKVTNANQLVAGNEYILVAPSKNKAMGSQNSGNYRNSVDVTLSEDKVVVSDDAVAVMTLGGSADAWTFNTSEGYLSYSSGNSVDVATGTSDKTNWKVTSDFQLESAKVTGRILRYNGSSPRFACYASTTQNMIEAYLYVKEGSPVGKTDVSTVTQLKTDLIVGQKFRVDDVIQWTDATDDRVSHNFGDWNNIELVDANHGLYAAVAAGEASFTGSFEYTPEEGQENPYNNVVKTFTFNVFEPITVAEALELTDLPKNVCVTGIISQIDEVSTQYGNATYWISDDGTTTNQMKVYRGKFLDGANFTANDQIAVGYTVTIIGQMQAYNEDNQFAQGNTIVSLKKPICTMTQLLTEVTLGQEYNLYDIIQVAEADGANPGNISRGVGGYGDSFDYTDHGNYKAVQEGPAQITLTWKYNPGEGNENPYTDVTKTFNLTIVNPDAVELLDLLSEKTTYTNEEDKQVDKVTYKREFSSKTAGHRQCWFVPFDYTITSEDLERCTFYRIHMFSATSDQEGVVQDENKVVMKITEVTEGYTLKANKPYIIKPKAVGVYEFVAENATLKAMDPGSLKRVSTTTNDYNFYGVYDSYTTAEEEQWFSMNTNGNLQWNAANQKLGAYRWYITSTYTGDDYANVAFVIDEEGEETTAIDQLFVDPNTEIEGIYTVDGVKLYKPAKGINIVKYTDGRTKKVYVK